MNPKKRRIANLEAADEIRDDLTINLQRPRKVPEACNQCRNRKIKCDGRRPVCSPCGPEKRSSSACSWSLRKTQGNRVSQADFLQLEHRLNAIESVRQPTLLKSAQVQEAPASLHSSSSLAAVSLDSRTESVTPLEDRHSIGRPRRLCNHLDAETVVKHIQTALSVQNGLRTESITSGLHGRQQTDATHKESWMIVPDFDLPSRQRSDRLLKTYWHSDLYSLVDREALETFYQRLWSGEQLGKDATVLLGLVNMVFCMACIRDSQLSSQDRDVDADVFYCRARQFIGLETPPSLLAAQCFLLISDYLQFKHDLSRASIFRGIASSMTRTLVLDMPPEDAANDIDCQTNLWKLWSYYLVLERQLEIALGRPAPTMDLSSTRMLCHATQTATSYNGAHQEYLAERSQAFSVVSLKFYDILDELWPMVHQFSMQKQPYKTAFSTYFGPESEQAVSAILSMEAKLGTLLQGLPAVWSHHSGVNHSKTTIDTQRTNTLWLLHHHLRLLLYRSVLTRFCGLEEDTKSEMCLPRKLALQFSVTCVETALAMLSFLFKQTSVDSPHQFELLPGWWEIVSLVQTTAGVLVTAHLDNNVLDQCSEEALGHGRREAIRILECYARVSPVASRSITTINELFDMVDAHNSGRDVTHQQSSHYHDGVTSPVYHHSEHWRRSLGIPTPSNTITSGAPSNIAHHDISVQHEQTTDPSGTLDWAFKNSLFNMTNFDTSVADSFARVINNVP